MAKRAPSEHQKRIRFLTGLSIFIIVALTVLLLLAVNRENLLAH
jgi:hypothetical protein